MALFVLHFGPWTGSHENRPFSRCSSGSESWWIPGSFPTDLRVHLIGLEQFACAPYFARRLLCHEPGGTGVKMSKTVSLQGTPPCTPRGRVKNWFPLVQNATITRLAGLSMRALAMRIERLAIGNLQQAVFWLFGVFVESGSECHVVVGFGSLVQVEVAILPMLRVREY